MTREYETKDSATAPHGISEICSKLERHFATKPTISHSSPSWFGKKPPFQSLAALESGDCVRLQFRSSLMPTESQRNLILTAAYVCANHPNLFIDGGALPVPASGITLSNTQYTAAKQQLQRQLALLEEAAEHYEEKLLQLIKKHDTHSHRDIQRTHNKLLQVAQLLAGANYLESQYELMQRNPDGSWHLSESNSTIAEQRFQAWLTRFPATKLATNAKQTALLQAAKLGDCAQLHMLLIDPDTDRNSVDADGLNPLHLAAKMGHREACELLLANGFSPLSKDLSQRSAYRLAMLNQHFDTAKLLDPIQAVELETIQQAPLPQGPSLKNRALRDVEYIFHCIIGAKFTSLASDRGRYLEATDAGGAAPAFSMSINSSGHVIANCPNGKQYNLSRALQYANLEYFKIDTSITEPNIIALCAATLGSPSITGPASKLTSSFGAAACSQLEEDAIRNYSHISSHYNTLLRGQPCVGTYYNHSTQYSLNKVVIESLLMISGVNKNIHIDGHSERSLLTRHEGTLPEELINEMKLDDHIVRRSGMQSYSCTQALTQYSNKLTIRDPRQSQGSIAHFSLYPGEKEVLFSPMHQRFTQFHSNEHNSGYHFESEIIHGVATEYNDQYTLMQATAFAYDRLKQPYTRSPDPRFGINRHNHALAHHVRACVYIDGVIDYFKQHASDEDFRKFCSEITPEELTIMQVMMLLSKTGRESEASPLVPEYMEFQKASADHLRQFMRNVMHRDEATIELYAEIMLHMGNPAYPDLVTGATESIKKRKQFINHITALAHKLDLTRVYTKDSYTASMSGYDGHPQSHTGATFITASAHQATDLRRLEAIATECLAQTGDRISYNPAGGRNSAYNSERFQRCNSDIDHCWQQCLIAKAKIKLQHQHHNSTTSIECLKNAIRDKQPECALEHLAALRLSDIQQQPLANKLLILAIDHCEDDTTLVRTLLKLIPTTTSVLEHVLNRACSKNKLKVLLLLLENRHSLKLKPYDFITALKNNHYRVTTHSVLQAVMDHHASDFVSDHTSLLHIYLLACKHGHSDIRDRITGNPDYRKRMFEYCNSAESMYAWNQAARVSNFDVLSRLLDHRCSNGLDLKKAIGLLKYCHYNEEIVPRIIKLAHEMPELHGPELYEMLIHLFNNRIAITSEHTTLITQPGFIHFNTQHATDLLAATLRQPPYNEHTLAIIKHLVTGGTHVGNQALLTLFKYNTIFENPSTCDAEVFKLIFKHYAPRSDLNEPKIGIVRSVYSGLSHISNTAIHCMIDAGLSLYPETASSSILYNVRGNTSAATTAQSIKLIRNAPRHYLNKKLNTGKTIAMHLIQQRDTALLLAVLDSDIDMSAVDNDGNTALHHAMQVNTDTANIIKLLDAFPANVWLIENKHGSMPLYKLISGMSRYGTDDAIMQHPRIQEIAQAVAEHTDICDIIVEHLCDAASFNRSCLAFKIDVYNRMPSAEQKRVAQLLFSNAHIKQLRISPYARNTKAKRDWIMQMLKKIDNTQLLDVCNELFTKAEHSYAITEDLKIVTYAAHAELLARIEPMPYLESSNTQERSKFINTLIAPSDNSCRACTIAKSVLTDLLKDDAHSPALNNQALCLGRQYIHAASEDKRQPPQDVTNAAIMQKLLFAACCQYNPLRLTTAVEHQEDIRISIQEIYHGIKCIDELRDNTHKLTVFQFLLYPRIDPLPLLRRMHAMFSYIRTGDNDTIKQQLRNDIIAICHSEDPDTLSQQLFREHMLCTKYRKTLSSLFHAGGPDDWTMRYRMAHECVLSKTDIDTAPPQLNHDVSHRLGI